MKIVVSEEAKNSEAKKYPAGIYKVRVVEATEGKSEAKKTPYLGVTFETIEGQIFKVKTRYYNTEKSQSVLLNFLSAIGMYNKEDEISFEINDILGQVLEVEFVDGEPQSNGKTYLEVKPWSCKAVANKKVTKAKKTEIVEEIDDEEIPF